MLVCHFFKLSLSDSAHTDVGLYVNCNYQLPYGLNTFAPIDWKSQKLFHLAAVSELRFVARSDWVSVRLAEKSDCWCRRACCRSMISGAIERQYWATIFYVCGHCSVRTDKTLHSTTPSPLRQISLLCQALLHVEFLYKLEITAVFRPYSALSVLNNDIK